MLGSRDLVAVFLASSIAAILSSFLFTGISRLPFRLRGLLCLFPRTCPSGYVPNLSVLIEVERLTTPAPLPLRVIALRALWRMSSKHAYSVGSNIGCRHRDIM